LTLRASLKRWLGLEKFTFERFLHLALFTGLPLMLWLEYSMLPGIQHYGLVRVGMALLSLFIYLASFRLEIIRRDFTFVNYVVIYLVISHIIFLTYVNDFTFFHSSLLISLILGASLFFRKRLQLLVFQGSMFLLVLQASFLAGGDAQVDAPLFLILYVFMNLSAFTIQDYIFRQRDRLQDAAEELMRSNKYLEQFAYATSHDLQEPLRTVTSYVQLLQNRYQGKLDSEADEFIHFTIDATGRMREMIQGLLKFSRVSSQNFSADEVELNEVLRQVTESLRVAIDESRAVIRYATMPVITGDRNMLAQLFQNLIGNAIKYRENTRFPVIEIDVQDIENGWKFSVRDNGIGIPRKYQQRVFEVFSRVQSKADVEGLGIGLALCKRIVFNHGGEIWVESEEGEGSTFFFTILR
jgi:signal transduction histidine kinase